MSDINLFYSVEESTDDRQELKDKIKGLINEINQLQTQKFSISKNLESKFEKSDWHFKIYFISIRFLRVKRNFGWKKWKYGKNGKTNERH